MNAWTLMMREIGNRPVSFLLGGLAIVIAAGLFVAGPTLLGAYANYTTHQLGQLQAQADKLQSKAEQMQQETNQLLADMDSQTKRIMRDLGVNLRIVHEETNMGSLYTDFVAHDFPESYVHKLAAAPQIETVVHLVATLMHKTKWNDRTILLVGTLPVVTESQKNEEKPHMVKNIEPGTVIVGHELGVNLEEGQMIDVLGRPLKVAKIMSEFGSEQDVQLMMHLKDAQEILDKQGQINQIMALNCKCKGDRLSVIRRELEGVLPDTKVTEHKTRAEAREKQRDLVAAQRKQQLDSVQANLDLVVENRDRQEAQYRRQEDVMGQLVVISTPLVVFVSAAFVGLMTWLNVRERRTEVGLLRALGKNTSYVITLFLGKSLLLGFIGGAIGCVLGFMIARWVGHAMDISDSFFQTDWLILCTALIGAPLMAAMASYLPTLSAVTHDPAVVLMDH